MSELLVDVVFLAAIEERRDDARAHHRLERAPDRRQRHAEVGGTIAIDRDLQLRLARVVVGIEVGQPGILRSLRQDDVAPARELCVVAAADNHLYRRTVAANAETARRHDRRAHPCQIRQHWPQTLRDLLRRFLALVEVRQRQHDTADADVAAAAEIADAR
jgi:hypothetical protein